jgi:hypothetical protein
MEMRKVLLGATAALAFVAPGVASAETSGHVGASYGNTEIDGLGEFDTYGIDGAVATDLGSNWLLQFDASSHNLDFDGGGETSAGGAYVHIAKRGSGHTLAGVVGMTDIFGLSGETIGAEGQMFFSSVTVNGSAVYGNFDEADFDVWNLHLDGTFFVTENFGLTGGVNHSEADSSGSEFDWTTWSADAAYRFANSPFSVFGGYAYTDFDDAGGEADTWRIGVRYDFGTDSLQASSQTGASLNGASAFASQLRFLD